MTDPVFFKPHDPDIPAHLWSSAWWGTRTKLFHLVEFMLIEVLVTQFSHFVWSTGAHLPAIIMFTVMTLGCAAGSYFWWLHMRPLSMYRMFDGNIDGHLISLHIPNKLAFLEEQKGKKWQKIKAPLTGLSDATAAYYDTLSESPENLVPDSRVMESLAVVETVLRQKATIRALTSSSASNDEDGVVYILNKMIGDAKDLIREETRRVREVTEGDAAMKIEQAINFAVNGPADKGVFTVEADLMSGDSQDPGATEADPAGEPSTGGDPDDFTLWGNDGGNVAHTFGTGFHGSCVQINQSDRAVQKMAI